MRTLLILFCSLLLTPAFAQDETDVTPPSQYIMYKATFYDVRSIDSLRTMITDSFDNPKGYVIDSELDKNKYGWTIAIKTKNGFRLFDPTEKDTYFFVSGDITIERVDLDGIGFEELIIRWAKHTGSTGIDGGIHWWEYGIQIWNLDGLTRIMAYENGWSHTEFWSSFTDPDTDSVYDGGGFVHCRYYAVTFLGKEIHLQETNECADLIGEEPKDKAVLIYKWTPKGIVRSN